MDLSKQKWKKRAENARDKLKKQLGMIRQEKSFQDNDFRCCILDPNGLSAKNGFKVCS